MNAGVHPIVPEILGRGRRYRADGGMAQVTVGLGRAEYQGELLPGDEAMRRAGITPLVLSGKDGLALISANGVSIGQAALVVARAEQVVDAADVAAALSMEATGANPSILHPAVARAKLVPGQATAADHIRSLLEGARCSSRAGPDRYRTRCRSGSYRRSMERCASTSRMPGRP